MINFKKKIISFLSAMAMTMAVIPVALGFSCVLWDNDLTGYGAENFGMINRNSLYVYYPSILNAMLNSFK
ncbi:MAG: hypothetical protein IJU04_03730 [Ruminococcus sp.]|nr:hypothetical protein [Ruminococcus sp.]